MKLDISRNSAEGYLKLVEIYMNNHKGEAYIKVTRSEDGTESYEIRFYEEDDVE